MATFNLPIWRTASTAWPSTSSLRRDNTGSVLENQASLPRLPDPDTLEVFSYYDPDTDEMVEIVSDDNTHPRKIDDYVIDPSDWRASNRGGVHYGHGSGPPVGMRTVEEILTHHTGNFGCIVCKQKGFACNGEVCIEIAKDHFQTVADFHLQIRKARWGFGVFAREDIPRGTFIGEYLGRVQPLDAVHSVHTAYIYTIGGVAECDAERYCNITHFINHNCNCNTNAIKVMYGKRAVIALKTNRDIIAGEEITIDYGTEYFNRYFPCECDAFEYPHTSETYRRRVSPDDGNVSLQGFRTRGGREQTLLGPIKKSVKQDPISKTPEAGQLESQPHSAHAEVKRQRTPSGLRSDKRGIRDRGSLRRSDRTDGNIFRSRRRHSRTKYYYATKQPILVVWHGRARQHVPRTKYYATKVFERLSLYEGTVSLRDVYGFRTKPGYATKQPIPAVWDVPAGKPISKTKSYATKRPIVWDLPREPIPTYYATKQPLPEVWDVRSRQRISRTKCYATTTNSMGLS